MAEHASLLNEQFSAGSSIVEGCQLVRDDQPAASPGAQQLDGALDEQDVQIEAALSAAEALTIASNSLFVLRQAADVDVRGIADDGIELLRPLPRQRIKQGIGDNDIPLQLCSKLRRPSLASALPEQPGRDIPARVRNRHRVAVDSK